ncbi:flagellar basal body P-ring formation protein FlgA [Vibrio astriarenae]|uniref:Flagella basal body P-ring formation protein FlgA n=1 Tax=Vibrio astriarenae TaxID=1481923 RepID=A0A7Z2T569_9VIBR|nr:flagellar basal body P-ring formation chaperone FlgA [Vibrio astriarenae]QIA64542.1 flagellar basal body P-ring formation protein FlgA [Vibrio astriarenae]
MRNKRLLVSAFMLVFVSPFTLAKSDIDTTKNEKISQVLKGDVMRQVEHMTKRNQWTLSKQTLSTTLPSGSHRLSCEQPLTVERRDKRRLPAGNLRYRVNCPDDEGWSIQAQAYFDASVPVVYAKQTIAKDKVLFSDDIEIRSMSLARMNRDFVSQPSRLIGQRAQRQLRQGKVIAPERVSAPYVIHRGEQVVMIAQGTNFSTSTAGVALESGYERQQIRVRNTSSGNVINAIVIEPGKVKSIF